MIGATDIFVSYKAEDRPRVQPLVTALEAEGFSVWWDTHIGGGAHWREDIEQHLDAAKCVIVVWSKRSIGPGGDFVRDEATRARKRGAYLPVRLDTVDAPLGFGEVQAILLKGWRGDRSDPRFLTITEAVRRRIAGEDIAHVTLLHERPAVSRRALVVGGAGVGVVAAAALGGWLLMKPVPANAKRIAVLPFANLSGDPAQAYFSDGIAEEVRSSLSRVGLQVIGRTSSDAVRNMDAKAAAAKLGVSNILTGSVRRSQSTIRIDAELVSGSDGVERWQQSYDRAPGDVIAVETDIAENVAQSLSVILGAAGRAALAIGGTSNPAAQELVLKAAHDFSVGGGDIDQMLGSLDSAISLDPKYADAYAWKAFILTFKAGDAQTSEASRRLIAEALAVANRAIEIAPRMAHGYDIRNFVYQWQLQLRLALADSEHAVALPGENVDAIGGYANLLDFIGRFPLALQLATKAISLDPLNPTRYMIRGQIFFSARHYPEALENARHATALAPSRQWGGAIIRQVLLIQAKYVEAEAEYQKLDPRGRLYGEALIAARTGRRSDAVTKLKMLQGRLGDRGHSAYADIYAQLGMKEEAFRELEAAWNVRDPDLIALRVNPFLDPLRNDSRFTALERKIGFP